MIKVLIADDHPIVLEGITRALSNEADIEIVGVANNPAELLRCLQTTPCDVVLTDYSMPGGEVGDGLPMLKTLRLQHPGMAIVVITMLDNPALINNILKTGIHVILNKATPTSHLLPGIRAAASGQAYLPPSVQNLLVSTLAERKTAPAKLSQRELEVLRQYAAGMTVTEIARQSNRSVKTISVQKGVAMRKLGLSNDHDLYQYAVSNGLLSGAQ